MKNTLQTVLLFLTSAALAPSQLEAHPDASEPADKTPVQPHSVAGSNLWNQAQAPADWWNEIKRVHGHVGPWNVLGWRMGKAALRELGGTWGQHELDVVCHVPLRTPYSCLADGLVVGTGNSIGRLDIRLAEVMSTSEIHVSARRKDATGPVLLLRPNSNYLAKIGSQPDGKLEALAQECSQLPEKELFEIEKMQPPL